MNRYNMFYQVHKGLRAMLYNTACTLQQTDFFNEAEADAAIAMVEEVAELFDEHAHTEDHFVLEALQEKEPAVSALFEQEHVQDHELSNRLRSLLQIFKHADTAEHLTHAGGAIRIAFTEFLVFNLQHMAKEEAALNEILWKHFTDQQLQEITRSIVTNIPPAQMARFSKWMMAALSNTEISDWLKEVKNNAPSFVFENMLALAEQEISVARWNTIRETMTEGAMLA